MILFEQQQHHTSICFRGYGAYVSPNTNASGRRGARKVLVIAEAVMGSYAVTYGLTGIASMLLSP